MNAIVLTPPPATAVTGSPRPIISTPSVPRPHPTGLPLQGLIAGFHKFSIDDISRMITAGIIPEDNSLEFLEGYLVRKMPRNPPHDYTIIAFTSLLTPMLPAEWHDRCQLTLSVGSSQPEPDHALVRGILREYSRHHPTPADLGIVIEVSDSSLAYDRGDKLRIYARGGVPEYWIVNLIDRQIEVYTGPQPTAEVPTYTTRTDYPAGLAVPLTLDGVAVGTIDVAAVLPE